MSVTDLNAGAPATTRPSMSLVCAEVRGGNRPIEADLDLPGMRGMIYSRPCGGGRGGDVHYLSVCGSGLLARLCIADVVGHGEKVAEVSAKMHQLLRRLMNSPDQRRILRQLNKALCATGLHAMTTVAALTYYPPSRKLSVSYAGHPRGWYFQSAADRWTRMDLERTTAQEPAGSDFVNGALGVIPDATFTRAQIRTRVGDRVVLLTDGVLETPGRGRDQFGERRIAKLLQEHRAESPRQLGRTLLRALQEHCGHEQLAHDDVTFLVADFVPGPAGPTLWHVLKNRLLVRRSPAQS